MVVHSLKCIQHGWIAALTKLASHLVFIAGASDLVGRLAAQSGQQILMAGSQVQQVVVKVFPFGSGNRLRTLEIKNPVQAAAGWLLIEPDLAPGQKPRLINDHMLLTSEMVYRCLPEGCAGS